MAGSPFSLDLVEAARAYDIVCVDIGARDGVAGDLQALGPAVSVVAFEPEAAEAQRLAAQPDPRWRSVRTLAAAVAGQVGTATLHLPPNPYAASLLPHNPAMLDRYGHEGLHGAGETRTVACTTLDALHADGTLPKASYLKIDVEGAELAILGAGEHLLRHTLVIRVEVSFLEQRLGQPLIWDLVPWLRQRGFECIDVCDIHRWRRRPVPGHPFRSGFYMPYSRGTLAQCDLLFLRESAGLADLMRASETVLILAALGYFDRAIQVLRETPDLAGLWLARHGFGLEAGLVAASRRQGRRVAWREVAVGLRRLVPRLRSALSGLSFSPPERPY